MPVVPVIQEARVSTSALPTPRVGFDTRGTHGEEIAESLGRIGQAAGNVALAFAQEKDKAEEADEFERLGRVQTAANQATEQLREAKGRDAFLLAQAKQKEVAQLREQLAGEIVAPKSKERFLKRSQSIQETYRHGSEMYLGQQREQMRVEQANGLHASSMNNVALNFADDNLVEEALYPAIAARASLATTDEGRKAAEQEVRGEAAALRLDMYIGRRDAKGAEALLARARPLLGKSLDNYEKQVGALREDNFAEDESLRLASLAAKEETGWIDEAKALAEVDKVPAAQREAVRGALRNRLTLSRQVESQQKGDAFNTALGEYQQSGRLSGINPKTKTWMQKHDSEGWQRLLDRARQDADRADARARGDGTDKPTPAQNAAYRSLIYDMAQNPSTYLDKGMSESVFNREWSHRLADSQLTSGVRELARFRMDANKVSETGALPAAVAKAYTDGFQAAGLGKDPRKFTPEQDQLFNAGYADIQALFARTQREQKRDPTQEEINASIKESFSPVKTKGKWWGTNETPAIKARVQGLQVVTDPSDPASVPSGPNRPPRQTGSFDLDAPTPAAVHEVKRTPSKDKKHIRIQYSDGTTKVIANAP